MLSDPPQSSLAHPLLSFFGVLAALPHSSPKSPQCEHCPLVEETCPHTRHVLSPSGVTAILSATSTLSSIPRA